MTTPLLSPFQKGVLGVFITALFSAVVLAALTAVSEKSFNSGARSVYEHSCDRACYNDSSSMKELQPLPHRNPREPQAYRCVCTNGNEYFPIPSKLYVEFDFPDGGPPVLRSSEEMRSRTQELQNEVRDLRREEQ